MPLKPDRLARTLKLAENSRSLYEKKLDENGVAAEDRKKDPRWRALNATCRTVESRIQSSHDLSSRGNPATEATEPVESNQD